MAAHCSTLCGNFHGQWNLAGYSPWGCKESDTHTHTHTHTHPNWLSISSFHLKDYLLYAYCVQVAGEQAAPGT